MRLRSLSPVVAALAVAGLVGCGSAAAPTSPVAAGSADAAAGAAKAAPGKTPAPGASTTPGAAQGSGGTAPAQPGATVPATGRKSATPTPAATPTYGEVEGFVDPAYQGTPEEVPIQAAVTPGCVARGATATLTVQATPKSQITFVAVYRGEKSGAAKPWGEGYGGNDKGTADHRGNATFTWLVSVDAPTGPARVLLVVATGNKQRAINVPFSVSEREADGCGT